MNVPFIQLLVLDVDGVLTPGDVTYDESRQRIMSFHIHDGSAIKRWRLAGRQCAIVSGRRSTIVERRAQELGIEHVAQGVTCKEREWRGLLSRLDVSAGASCCIGDDLGDVEIVRQCGFGVAVSNAAPVLKRWASYITRRPGGQGAVAEVVEWLMGHETK